MGLQLPDFAELQERHRFNEPQPEGQLPQFPTSDPAALATEKLGGAVEQAGGAALALQASRNHMDMALATANLDSQLIPLKEQLRTETDPAKIDALQAQVNGLPDSVGASIGDPGARQMWAATQASGKVGEATGIAVARQHEVYVDQFKAGVESQLDQQLRLAQQASDPADRETAQHNIGHIIGSAESAGVIGADKAQELMQGYGEKIITGSAQWMDANGNPQGALDYLHQNAQHVNPATLDTLTRGLQERTDKAGDLALTNSIWGGSDKGFAGNRGALGAPSAAPVAPDEYRPLIAQAANANGVPPELLTRLLSAENSFKPTGVSSAGARGIAQFMPETAKQYGVDPDDPTSAIPGAARYLKDLHDQTGSWLGALKGYLGGDPTHDPSYMSNGVPQLAAQLDKGVSGGGSGGTDTAPLPGVVDKTAAAGFGDKFGPLNGVKGFIIHHTGGGENVDQVISTFKQTGYPAQFVIDRQGTIYRTLPEGMQGQHIQTGRGVGEGLSNANTEGVEIIANNDGNVLPVQEAAAARLVGSEAAKYGFDPKTAVFGHGEVNPGHKEADEGMSTVSRIRSGALNTNAPGAVAGQSSAQVTPPAFDTQHAAGMVTPGNLDPWNRPVLHNSDGSYSTTSSMSIGTDAGETLIPTVVDGKRLSNDAAIAHFKATGENLGTFSTPAAADTYATSLHNAQASMYDANGNPKHAASAAGSGLTPLPDIDAKVQQVQDLADQGKITQEQANRVQAQLHSRYSHVQASQANDRAMMVRTLSDGVAALSAGHDFDYAPAAVRHFFPQDKADEVLQQLQDAKEGGQLITGMRTASPDQVAAQRATLAAKLDQPGALDYAKNSRFLAAFDTAFNERNKALSTDPIAYLGTYDPLLQQKRAAIDPKNPQTSVDYATTALSEQSRLGVPAEQQHVMTMDAAQRVASAITNDPGHAPDTMRTIATQYGAAWPHVWSDLITLGKLPAGYQVVGQLADYDQTNAAVLSRALGASAKDDKSFHALVGAKAPGGKSIEDVAHETVPVDQRVMDYERSLTDSGASPSQVFSVRSAIQDLAAGRAIFLHEDPATATDKAIDAVVGHYEFAPNGGARAPRDRFDDVTANARMVLNGRTVENMTIPPAYGTAPGMPKPQEYIDMLQAAPTWITGPKADQWMLVDPGGRLAKNANGQPVVVPFSMPRLPAPDVTMPPVGP
jgi:hypothetical protein